MHKLILGDALETMANAKEESVHAIVTDAPYGLSDKTPDMTEVLTHWLAGDDYTHGGGGFMGKTWDSFVPGPAVWKEALRVLKPGGHLLAFTSTRTVDLMGISIRMAGFEIRDSISWLQAEGYPKAHNVGKMIDNQLFADWLVQYPDHHAHLKSLTGAAKKAYELELRGYAGLVRPVIGESTGEHANGPNQLVSGAERVTRNVTSSASLTAEQWEGWRTALKPMNEPIIVARKPLGRIAGLTPKGRPTSKEMTVAQNVLEYGTGAYNVAACQVGSEVRSNPPGMNGWNKYRHEGQYQDGDQVAPTAATGRFPGNVILDEGAQELLDQQAPKRKGAEVSKFFFVAKTKPSEKNEGLPEGVVNDHPTVKPKAIMQQLIRLVTPPGGVVLDPFMGSGTTGVAATLEGFHFVGVEIDPHYFELAQMRLDHAAAPSTVETVPA